MTWGKGCPEVFRFLTQTKGRGVGPDGTDARSIRHQEIGNVGHLLSDLSLREYRHPNTQPIPLKSTVEMRVRITTAHKRGIQDLLAMKGGLVLSCT